MVGSLFPFKRNKLAQFSHGMGYLQPTSFKSEKNVSDEFYNCMEISSSVIETANLIHFLYNFDF